MSPTPFLQLTNVGNDGYAGLQQGIFSIALDPNFATNHYYYIFYTTRTPNRDRLSRFTADATLTATNLRHRGRPLPGSAGRQHRSITAGRSCSATTESSTSRRAIISRARPSQDPDESAREDPSHQPGWDGADRQPVLRRERAERRLDLGARSAQSLPRLLRRADRPALHRRRRRQRHCYRQGGGQPRRGGRQLRLAEQRRRRAPAPAQSPLYSYAHNGRDASITGGFVYHGTQFPSSYQGSYFFADYAQNWIKRLTFDASGNVTGVFNFEPPDGSVRRPLRRHRVPHGGARRSALLRRPRLLRHQRHLRRQQDPPDPLCERQPGADRGRVGELPPSGPAPLAVSFSSAGSSDPEGQALTYAWTFGDGATSTAANPSHTYAQAGQYSARLSVSDGVNTTFSTPISISVGSPRRPPFSSPQRRCLLRRR